MKAFRGVYRGFSPTDESPIGLGELELTIGGEGVTMRFATGIEIQEETFSIAQFIPMTKQEVMAQYRQGSKFPARSVGFRAVDGIPKLIFLRNARKDEFALVVRLGEMSSILGPTLMFSPTQVAAGLFDKVLDDIKKVSGDNVFPLLSRGGKA